MSTVRTRISRSLYNQLNDLRSSIQEQTGKTITYGRASEIYQKLNKQRAIVIKIGRKKVEIAWK